MIKDKLSLVPHLPGSYQMKDKDGIIIYVGKAKDLKNRLNSYFNREVTGKTKKLVSEICDFEYIVTTSELEAFLLEINLIKKYDPKYNILLKDDKSYPYIEYVSTPYPTLKVVRYLNIKKKDNKHLFGPYVNAYAARRIVSLINRLYPLKKCDTLGKNLCLYYHINECLGYCTKCVDKTKVEEMEHEILSFLRGNDEIILNKLNSMIEEYSNNLNYEAALELKQELDYIKVVLEKQHVELHDYIEDIESYLTLFYSKNEIPKEILVPKDINVEILSNCIDSNIYIPIKGIKKKLLDMAYNNAKINLDNNFETITRDIKRTNGANEELESILGMKINRIDSFDNSNLFGSFAVSGMVVYKNGVPSKNDYRKYKVSVDKNDDYNTMKEVTYRRYYKALLEHTELPDLILADGGINQINAVKDTLNELNLSNRIKVCGLVKNDKHRTSDLLDGDTLEVIELDRTSNVFHYLTRIQDEVHRFTINYHRELRSKGSIKSILDDIEGIGTVRKKELINKYGSVKKISEASVEELKTILPESTAIYLAKYLHDFYNKDS